VVIRLGFNGFRRVGRCGGGSLCAEGVGDVGEGGGSGGAVGEVRAGDGNCGVCNTSVTED
jgi:hypothetical protein